MGVKADLAYDRWEPQREVWRHDRAPRSCTNSSRSASPIRPIRRSPDESGNFDPAFAPYDLTQPAARRSPTTSRFTDQAAGGVRPGRHQGARRDVQARRPGRSLRRSDDRDARRSLVSACRTPCRAAGRCCAASYGRTLETPYNENLLLSAGYGLNGLFGTSAARRRQASAIEVEVGVQQSFGRWLVADVGYFDKRTDNGYDFGVLFNTPIAFPDLLGSLAASTA